jgi:hypothetical protein
MKHLLVKLILAALLFSPFSGQFALAAENPDLATMAKQVLEKDGITPAHISLGYSLDPLYNIGSLFYGVLSLSKYKRGSLHTLNFDDVKTGKHHACIILTYQRNFTRAVEIESCDNEMHEALMGAYTGDSNAVQNSSQVTSLEGVKKIEGFIHPTTRIIYLRENVSGPATR